MTTTSRDDAINEGGLIDQGDQWAGVAVHVGAGMDEQGGEAVNAQGVLDEHEGAKNHPVHVYDDEDEQTKSYGVAAAKRMAKASDQEKAAFLLLRLSEGKALANSWKSAGFASSAEARRILDSPSVRANAMHLRDSWIRTIGAAKAIHRLDKLMADGVSPSVQFSAAKMVLELAGHTKGNDAGEKPQAEMTEAELQEFIDRMERQIANGKAPVIKIKP